MNSITTLDGHLTITFKKKTMRTLLTQAKYERELDTDNMEDETEKILAGNLSFYLSRTESVTLCDVPFSPTSDDEITLDANKRQWVKCRLLAEDWVKFWNYVQKNIGKPNAVFMAYTEALPIEVDNLWADALNEFDNSDPTLNDPELLPPHLVPDAVLNDPDVKKSVTDTDKVSAPTL